MMEEPLGRLLVTFRKYSRYRMKIHTRIDKELVSRAKAQDTVALGRIYDLFVERIYRFVYVRVGRREDAEDVTEQVFVKVLKNIGNYEERGLPFEAWLFRIVRNLVTDYYRGRRKTFVPLDEAVHVIDPKPKPEEAVSVKLQYEEVLEQIRKLPERYQEIIELKFIEELTNDEISHILKKPVDQIRVLQSRALAKLKTYL